ncbi:MAG: hypothetical protein ACI4AO_03675, partial [Anaerotignum sp.]
TIEAPVTEGQTVGTLKVSLGGETIKTVDLKAQNAVDAMTDEQKAELDKSSVSGILKKVGIGIVVVILAFLILICITRTIGHYQRKKRRQQRRRRTRRSRRDRF